MTLSHPGRVGCAGSLNCVLGVIDVSDSCSKVFRHILILISCVAAAALLSACTTVQPTEPVSAKVLWIPMDSDSTAGALDADGLLGFSTGSVELSPDDLAAIRRELASPASVAESAENLASYRKNVRLLVLVKADIVMISDGCRLIDSDSRKSIDLPQKLVDAINLTPPVSKSWACRS